MKTTIRNANIAAVAAAGTHPTSERDIERFVRALPLSQIADVCEVADDLYGARVLVFDREGLARAWTRAGLGRGFDLAADLAEARVERANRI